MATVAPSGGLITSTALTLLILPALLKRRSDASQWVTGNVLGHYSNMTPYPRLAVRCRQRGDPVLDELATLVPQQADMANILDVGCGHGLPACWLADRYPTAIVTGIDPDAGCAHRLHDLLAKHRVETSHDAVLAHDELYIAA